MENSNITLHQSVNIHNHNKMRKQDIKSIIKLIHLGSQVIPQMSVYAQRELFKYAEKNMPFSTEIWAELTKIEKGREFTSIRSLATTTRKRARNHHKHTQLYQYFFLFFH